MYFSIIFDRSLNKSLSKLLNEGDQIANPVKSYSNLKSSGLYFNSQTLAYPLEDIHLKAANSIFSD